MRVAVPARLHRTDRVAGGDDSQASVRIPVSAKQADEVPRSATPMDSELALRARDFRRRKLWRVWPRGGEASTYWAKGVLVVLPHDLARVAAPPHSGPTSLSQAH